ncbi:MAG: toxin [Deltaproteobacteria bacterium]|nr:toxin [Deltaproteobacteria bacterium]
MRRFVWKLEKNEWLKKERGLSFEQIEEAISAGGFKGTLINRAHPEQIIIVVLVDGYIVAVPATVEPTVIVFWTAYYSRKLNKRYGGKEL